MVYYDPRDPTLEKSGHCSHCGTETIDDWCPKCKDFDDHHPDPDSERGGHDDY